MKLKASPYQVFEGQDDPISLHVRRNWLNENGQTQKTIEHTITHIVGKLSDEGSWGINQKERDTFLVMDSLRRKSVDWSG